MKEVKPKVLIADDDDMLRLMAREALHQSFDLIEASNGRDAVRAFVDNRPDIVVLDVVMPGYDGFEACAEIRSLPRGMLTPILMVTGSDDVESIHRAYGVGATDFATKPINYLLLFHRLYYMLRTRETLAELRRTERRLTRVQKTARLGAWEFDVESESLRLYDAAVDILEMEAGAWGTASVEDLFPHVHVDDRAKLQILFDGARSEGQPFNLLHRVDTAAGDVRWVYQDVEVVDVDDRRVLTGVAQDVTERQRKEQRIFELAYYDDLTGLPNRNYLTEHLRYLFDTADNEGRQVTLISLDLDFFKGINDSLGQKAGDAFLVEISKRLRSLVASGNKDHLDTRIGKPWNLVSRPGDDEFVVVVPTVGPTEAFGFAESLRASLAQPVKTLETEVVLTSSIGIATYPTHGETPSDVLKNAQAATNEAKRRGRNRCITYSPAMEAEALRRLSLDSSLRRALANDEFCLYYQPKVNVGSNTTDGMEALIRWKHPESGVVSPGEFLPVAEETGLIVPIGEWVLRTACVQLRLWQDMGLVDLTMSVNISARQFEQPDLAGTVRRAIEDAGIAAASLELEVTEDILLQDDVNAREVLLELEALGVRIAMDDFGTGYSSLSYLKKFPIHTVKIDRSFVSDVTVDADSSAIVSAIIGLAHGLNLVVVAEGVETREQLRFLEKLGCIQHQGFYFSRPLPPQEAANWVMARSSDMERMQQGPLAQLHPA